MHKKLTSLLTVLVIVTMNANIVKAAPVSNNTNNQVNLQQNRTNLKNAEKKVEEIEQNIEHLDYQIENKMIELDNTKKRIEDVQKVIQTIKIDIEKIENDIEEEKKLYNKRIRNMYIQSTGGYMAVLLGAEDLSDLFFRVKTLQKIWELDKKIVKSLNEKYANIQNKKEQMILENDRLVSIKLKQEQKMDELKGDKLKQEKLIEEAKKQARLYIDKIKKEEELLSETKQIVKEARKSTPKYIPSRGATAISDAAIVAYASNFLGTPYKWGANGPNYFDCSGYTKYIFAHFGINIPRVSRDQAKGGVYVPKSQLKPGDLVFYAYNNGKGDIHHVGMYIGNGMYIHAPRTGDVVKISPVDRNDYATARRYK